MGKNNEVKRGQWRTGYFIRSVKTAHWPQQQADLINEDENRIVFENFTEEDKGRSRKRICICENKEDAALICEAVNNYDKLKEDNEVLLNALKVCGKMLDEKKRKVNARLTSYEWEIYSTVLKAIKQVESK